MKKLIYLICTTLICTTITMQAFADDAAELARKAHDPLANISAVQMDMSAKFNIGPDQPPFSPLNGNLKRPLQKANS